MALQADPGALRMAAKSFSGASNAMEGTLNAMNQRILVLVEDGQSGWIGDGVFAFLSRLNTEVNHYRNGIHTLRQIPPILSYLAMEMDEIIDLRRRAMNWKQKHKVHLLLKLHGCWQGRWNYVQRRN